MGDFVTGLFGYLLGEGAKELSRQEDSRDLAENLARMQRATEAARTYAAPQLIPENPPVSPTPLPPGLDLGGSASGEEPADDGPSFTAPTTDAAAPADVEFSRPPATVEVPLTVSDGGGATGTPLTEGPPVTTALERPAPAAAASEPGTVEAEPGMSTFAPVMSAAEPVAPAAGPPYLTVELSTQMVEPTALASEPTEAAPESVTLAYGRAEPEYQPAAEPGQPQSGESPGGYALKRWVLAFGIGVALLGLAIFLVAHSRSSSTAPTGPSSLTGGATSPQPGSFSNILLPNNTLAFVPGVCPAATLHLSWTLTGIAPDTVVVIHLSGRGVPASLTFRANPGAPFGQDFPISGPGTWSTTIVSIGGQPPPPAVAPDAVHSGPYTC